MKPSKIATCCYCGNRAALVLTGRVRHELSCASCGAPLHELKMLRSDHHGQRELVKPSAVRGAPRREEPAARRKKGKRRKSLKRRLFEEALELLEDVFD